MLIAGSAAGVLLAVLLILGVVIYRRRRAQDEEDDMLAEMEDDWRFQPRLSVSAQGGPGTGRKFSARSGRKPSMAHAGMAGGGGASPSPWSAGGGGYGPSYGGANPNMLGGRGSRPSLTVGGFGMGGGGGGGSGGLDLPRRPSRADLSQMDVYRKMSVIGIV